MKMFYYDCLELPVGSEIRPVEKDLTHVRGVVTSTGFHVDGRTFASPSEAAKRVVLKEKPGDSTGSRNGWTFWEVQIGGTWRTFANLRGDPDLRRTDADRYEAKIVATMRQIAKSAAEQHLREKYGKVSGYKTELDAIIEALLKREDIRQRAERRVHDDSRLEVVIE